jgi:hypothetical protein
VVGPSKNQYVLATGQIRGEGRKQNLVIHAGLHRIAFDTGCRVSLN